MTERLCAYLMTLLLVLLCGCDFPTSDNPETQSGKWEVVRGSQGDSFYRGLFSVDQHDGWIVGDAGRILHTNDGGDTWESQRSGTQSSLYSIVFVDRLTGWASGGSNTIIHTTNGGISWTSQGPPSDTAKGYLSIFFVDKQTGWAVSNYGDIVSTRDAGTTWSYQKSGVWWALTSVYFLDHVNGWAVATNRIVLSTHDGGNNWFPREIADTSPAMFTDVYFADEKNGWIATSTVACCSCTMPTGTPILSTSDGGSTWRCRAVLPVEDVRSLYLTNKNIGWAVGMNQIFCTGDGGRTWLSQYKIGDDYLVGVSFVDSYHGWVLGFRGTVLRYSGSE